MNALLLMFRVLVMHSEEERQKRLAEMMSNANEHEQQRDDRLQRAK